MTNEEQTKWNTGEIDKLKLELAQYEKEVEEGRKRAKRSAYLLLYAVLGNVLTLVTAIVFTYVYTQRSLQGQQRAQAAAQEQGRKIACSFLSASLDVYVETPPSTATGRNLQQSYLDLYRVTQCQPFRDK